MEKKQFGDEETTVKIRAIKTGDEQELTRLVAEFRVTLAKLRGNVYPLNNLNASDELSEFTQKQFPIFVAEGDNSSLLGYLVCRVDGDVVWVEALYVRPQYRRRGIGSALFAEAERVAREKGSDTLYNWVDPNNHEIIGLLQKRGYDVLNLIEVRHLHKAEKLSHNIVVGSHIFNH